MNSSLTSPISYNMKLGEQTVDFNSLIGKQVSLHFTGNIYCQDTGKKIKKTYGQGYCFESFMTLARCDSCIFSPELCHYKQGTCREPEWGEKNCLQPHIVYLANSSGLKVGITRKTQVPTRWIDQGASSAIAICEVKDRKSSGVIERQIAKTISDKTNWRNMLKNIQGDVDLIKEKAKIIELYADELKKVGATILADELIHLEFPVIQYPAKVTSLNLDKNPQIDSLLLGIKGQYLIFESGVINMRKYQGYEICLNSH